jgi:polysaccharide export outer membrane protein
VRTVLALLLLATGCASISPGLHLSEDRIGGGDEPARVIPVTTSLLLEQAKQRAEAATARPREPGAAEQAGYEYRIAPFDVLSVTVWDHPELTIPAGEFRAAEVSGNPVQADGTVFYPHVGIVKVAGLTTPEVRALLTERLQVWVQNPQLDVRVAAFRGQRVQVTGEVVQPTAVPITDVPLRIQDAIAAAKGLGPNAWPRSVTLTRGGRVHSLDLAALYDDGDLSQNWLLQDGDLVNVPSRERNKVFVLGEVKRPSSKLMARGRMTLAEAIGDSEGVDPLTSNPGEIYVIRGRYDAPQVYRLDASNADALLLAVQFELQPLDVVFVAPYKLTNWNRVMQQILPTIQGLWQAVDLANRSAQAVTP